MGSWSGNLKISFYKASRKKGITGEVLLQLIESRLDNVVFRLGIGPTRSAARQLIGHRHIVVNGKVVNVPSFEVKPGDIIGVRERSKSLESSLSPSLPGQMHIPGWNGTDMRWPENL